MRLPCGGDQDPGRSFSRQAPAPSLGSCLLATNCVRRWQVIWRFIKLFAYNGAFIGPQTTHFRIQTGCPDFRPPLPNKVSVSQAVLACTDTWSLALPGARTPRVALDVGTLGQRTQFGCRRRCGGPAPQSAWAVPGGSEHEACMCLRPPGSEVRALDIRQLPAP